MSTAARPALAIRTTQPTHWAPWVILGVDVLALEVSFGLGLGVRELMARWLTSVFFASIGPSQYLGVAIAILVLPLVHYQIGLYPGYLLGPVERLRRRMLAAAAVFGVLAAWDNIVERGVLSRGVLLATFGFALILPALGETMARAALVRRGRWGIPVVVLGAGETGRGIARTLIREPQLGLRPVAFLDNHPATWEASVEGLRVAGPLGLAQDMEDRAEAAIVALGDLEKSGQAGGLDREEIGALLQELNFPRVIVVPNLAAMATLWVTARDLSGVTGGGGAGCVGLEIKKNLLLRRNTALKRAMDQAIALPLFVASLPVMAVAAVWIKATSRGPAFYRQMREGLDGRRIAVWKLRTMYQDAEAVLDAWLAGHPEDREEWSRFFKLRRDPRVLPGIGRLLRRTSLDELPQLWSVLKGEMSLVGPRPFPDYHLGKFSPEFRRLRTRVLPGLTGLWQVSARSDGGVEVQESLDTYYIRNWSPWLDLYLLARTVAAVLLARGAY
jgi:Undecaprenyl-phosphate galactose phosphotransferase WbaP